MFCSLPEAVTAEHTGDLHDAALEIFIPIWADALSGRMEINMTLKNAKIGSTVTIKGISGKGAVKRRIMDMGITKGTSLYIRKAAPLGDPIEVTVRGYELSIRKSDADMIEVI